MNANALIITICCLTSGFCIFESVTRNIQLRKIKKERQKLQEAEDITVQMNMYIASIMLHHDYKPEEVVNLLLDGIKRYKYDEKMAATTFALYNSVTALADSARENGIIK